MLEKRKEDPSSNRNPTPTKKHKIAKYDIEVKIENLMSEGENLLATEKEKALEKYESALQLYMTQYTNNELTAKNINDIAIIHCRLYWLYQKDQLLEKTKNHIIQAMYYFDKLLQKNTSESYHENMLKILRDDLLK